MNKDNEESLFTHIPTVEELMPTPQEAAALQELFDWSERSRVSIANKPVCNHPDGVESFWHPNRKPAS